MATKIYCDGCDIEVKEGQYRNLRIKIVSLNDSDGETILSVLKNDLCKSCEDVMFAKIDVRHWPKGK